MKKQILAHIRLLQKALMRKRRRSNKVKKLLNVRRRRKSSDKRNSRQYCAIGERLGKHILEIIISLVAIIGVVCMYLNVEDVKKEDLVTPLCDISAKQDSICKSIQFFIEKNEPVRVNTKTFNNSAFFNAEKVGSVHVKLY